MDNLNMEAYNPTPSLIKHAVRWALIAAAVSMVMTIIIYVVDYALLVQLKYMFCSFIIYLGITIYAGIEYRKLSGGFLSYAKAYQHGFLIFVVSALVSVLFNFILYYVIDPELPQKLVDASMENTRAWMEKFGIPGDQVDPLLEKEKIGAADRFTILGQAKGFIWVIVFSGIMAAISALIVKRKQPEPI